MEKFINWSKDEAVFAYSVTNEILFVETSKPGILRTTPTNTKNGFVNNQNDHYSLSNALKDAKARSLRVENLQSFSLHSSSMCVAVHAAGKKVTILSRVDSNLQY